MRQLIKQVPPKAGKEAAPDPPLLAYKGPKRRRNSYEPEDPDWLGST